MHARCDARGKGGGDPSGEPLTSDHCLHEQHLVKYEEKQSHAKQNKK